MTPFIVVVVNALGERMEWELAGTSPAKVLMAAVELCPECEIVSIHKKGEWN